jgi:hypothetical protein
MLLVRGTVPRSCSHGMPVQANSINRIIIHSLTAYSSCKHKRQEDLLEDCAWLTEWLVAMASCWSKPSHGHVFWSTRSCRLIRPGSGLVAHLWSPPKPGFILFFGIYRSAWFGFFLFPWNCWFIMLILVGNSIRLLIAHMLPLPKEHISSSKKNPIKSVIHLDNLHVSVQFHEYF